MTKIIAFGNQKGGVAKTSSALNVAYSLANTYGQKVLLIDMDSQGSASLNLGIDVASPDTNTIDAILQPYVLRTITRLSWNAIRQAIYRPTFQDRIRDPQDGRKWLVVDKPFGFDVIPASLDLSVVELQMGLMGGKYFHGIINSTYLQNVTDIISANADYDWIVIDTPPSLGALSVNSMAAAKDGIVICSNLDIMALRGIPTFISTVESTISAITSNPTRGVLGIELSMFSPHRTVDRDINAWIDRFLPTPTFNTHIPDTSDARKANSSALLVSQINKKMKKAYDDLTNEIINAVEHPELPVGNKAKKETD